MRFVFIAIFHTPFEIWALLINQKHWLGFCLSQSKDFHRLRVFYCKAKFYKCKTYKDGKALSFWAFCKKATQRVARRSKKIRATFVILSEWNERKIHRNLRCTLNLRRKIYTLKCKFALQICGYFATLSMTRVLSLRAVFKNCTQRQVKKQALRFCPLCGDDLTKNLYSKSAL